MLSSCLCCRRLRSYVPPILFSSPGRAPKSALSGGPKHGVPVARCSVAVFCVGLCLWLVSQSRPCDLVFAPSLGGGCCRGRSPSGAVSVDACGGALRATTSGPYRTFALCSPQKSPSSVQDGRKPKELQHPWLYHLARLRPVRSRRRRAMAPRRARSSPMDGRTAGSVGPRRRPRAPPPPGCRHRRLAVRHRGRGHSH